MDHQSGASSDQRNERYKGVTRLPSGSYGARISIIGVQTWIGTFPTLEAAARAYDQAAVRMGRPINTLNFPEEHRHAAANASTITAAAAVGVSAPPMRPLMTAEHPDAGAANASTMTAAAATSSSSTSSMATREVTDEYDDYLKNLKLGDLVVLPHLDDDKVNK